MSMADIYDYDVDSDDYKKLTRRSKMSEEYDNTNRGVLFKNDKKESDRHPDYNGTLNVNGVEHWFSAWIKTSKKGNKFMSLSLGAAKEAREAKPAQAPAPANDDFDDQDIPF